MDERKEMKTASQRVTESKCEADPSHVSGPQVKNVKLTPHMYLVPRLRMWS